jgi:hypothetical protein
VTGTAGNAITLADTELVLVLSGLALNSTLTISHSSAAVVFDGANAVGRMVCSDSNVTVQAIYDDSAKVVSSDSNSAAIGAAAGGRCGSLRIANGSVSAHAGAYAAGIGTGSGNAAMEALTIVRGNITASCTANSYARGSGIGSGSGTSRITDLAIVGGNATARCSGFRASGSGIGTGEGGTLTRLSLFGPLIVRTTGMRAQSILLPNGSLVFVTQASALFSGSGSLSMSESVDLAILYGQPMTENATFFSGLANPFLRFENIADAPEGGGLRWCPYRRDKSGVSSMNSFASGV